MPRLSVEELRRGEIINAAILVIARDGYEATTMRGLAAELQVSTGTITHWFATKDQVLGAALQEAAERVARRIDAAVEGIDDPLEVLIRLGEANVPDTPEAIAEQRVWTELEARAARTPALAERYASLYDGWRRRIERVVKDLQQDETFGAIDAGLWALTYATLIDGLALHVLLHPGAVAPEEMRAVLREYVRTTLVRR